MDLLSPLPSPDQVVEELLQFVYLMPVAIAQLGATGTVDMINPKAVQLLQDLDIDAGTADGPRILKALSPGLEEQWRASAGRIGPVMEPLRCTPARRGNRPDLHLLIRMVRSDEHCTMLAIEDVTTVVEQEREIFRQRRRMEVVLTQIHGYCVQMLDAEGKVVDWNPSIGHLFGYAHDDVVGTPLLGQVASELQRRSPGSDFSAIATTVDRQGWCRLQAPFSRLDGSVLWGDCVISPVVETSGNTSGYVAVIRDVTDDHHRTQRLIDDALTDQLTGLYNRRGLEQVASELLEGLDVGSALQTLVMVDIDHFKQVNDTYGHDGGDEVLKSVAHALKGSARAGDCVARFGGEEFVLLLPETSAAGAVDVAERMRLRIEALIVEVASRPVKVTASFGVAPQAGGEPWTSALERADAALYRAKREGRNRVVLYKAL